MKIHFNRFERVAGLFVLGAFAAMIFSLLTVAFRQGWFATKIPYVTEFESAEGVHAGTAVQVAGLRAGSVDDVELTTENHILVHFSILEKFQDKIRTDSRTSLIRPFVIGERVIDVTPGTAQAAATKSGDVLISTESTDLLSLLSGRNMGRYLDTFSNLLGEVHHIAEGLLSHDHGQSIVDTINSLRPLVMNLNSMSQEVTKVTRTLNSDERLKVVLDQVATTTGELNRVLPEFTQTAPGMAKDLKTLVGNLAELSDQFKVLTPVFVELGPQLPRVSKRAVEALDEAVVLMKSIERSWVVRSNVKEVREEEESKTRAPASP